MTAPNPKEALEPFAKAAENYADCTDDGKFIDDDATVTVGNLRDARAALATLPPAGERREAIARIIAGPLCDATKGEHSVATRGNYKFCTQCGETISKRWHGIVDARNKADALFASGLVQDEATIRADEREKCAEIADREAEFWQDAESSSARIVAANIRSARDGGAES